MTYLSPVWGPTRLDRQCPVRNHQLQIFICEFEWNLRNNFRTKVLLFWAEFHISVWNDCVFFLPYLFDFKTFGRAWNWFQLSIYPKQKSHTQMQNAFETICALRATQTLRPGQICERKKSEMCVKHSCNYLQFSLFWWYLSSVHFVQNLNLVRIDAEFIL